MLRSPLMVLKKGVQLLGLLLLVTTVVACGGSGDSQNVGSHDSDGLDAPLRGAITLAEFSPVSPPSLSRMSKIVRDLVQITAALANDPDTLARAVFNAVRDGVDADLSASPVNAAERLRERVNGLTRQTWAQILREPLNGVIAAHWAQDAIDSALLEFTCPDADLDFGKSHAVYQALFSAVLAQRTSARFAQQFIDGQADGLTGIKKSMLLSNAAFGRDLAARFALAGVDDLMRLIGSAAFIAVAPHVDQFATAAALVFLSGQAPFDGSYDGQLRDTLLGIDEAVRLDLNQCGDRIRARLRTLDGDQQTRDQWRLDGSIDENGRIQLQLIQGLEQYLQSAASLICQDLRLELTERDGQLVGPWRASRCRGGTIELSYSAAPG